MPHTRTVEHADQLPTYVVGAAFVRPCPVRPRHGFVDSRICRTPAEIRAVWDEARAADPEAELVIMTPIDAACSAVLAGSRLAIGPGHDGATSGHDVHELQVIPLALDYRLLAEAGLGSDDTAFLELVACKYTLRTYAVQLRAGPALPSSPDYVPAETVVTAIVAPHDDLQRWEQEVPDFSPGTVVVAPGGSLASHAAIHCVLHGVPFITSRTPAIGSTIMPSGAPTFTLDETAFMRGSAVADHRLTYDARESCRLAVLLLHQWAMLRGAPTASFLLGFACRVMARAGAAICAGEARHYSLKLKRQRAARVSRSARIAKSLAMAPRCQRRALTLAGKAFELDGWRGGFGGPAWRECASAVDRLWRAQARDLTEAGLVEALNRVVNVAHNNGALLNKLVDPEYLNRAAADPTRHLLQMLPALFAVLACDDAAPVVKLPKGGRLARPAVATYSHMHVHTEPSGVKVHLWNPGEDYVSHHIASNDPELLEWINAQAATSKSRHDNSDRLYVPITLTVPIEASAAAILSNVYAAKHGAS